MDKFEPGRELTFAEKKINRQGYIDFVAKQKKRLGELTDEVKIKMMDGTISKKDAQVQLAEACTSIQLDSFNYGKQMTSKTMGVKVSPTNKRIEGVMLQQNMETVGEMLKEIETRVGDQDLGSVFATINGIIASFFGGMDTLFIIGTINLARETVFEENMALVYAFEYSAILDSKTSNICRDLDGTIFPATAKSLSDYSPPRHYMCRSLMIEILQDDPYKPAIDTKTIKNPGSDEPLPFSLAK